MLKLSIPSVDDFYADLIAHPRVVRVVALSGGYPRDEANERLARQHGMIASFSPRPHRGVERRSERRRVRRCTQRDHRRHLRRVHHLSLSSAVISRRNASASARSRVRFIGGSALTMSHR